MAQSSIDFGAVLDDYLTALPGALEQRLQNKEGPYSGEV